MNTLYQVVSCALEFLALVMVGNNEILYMFEVIDLCYPFRYCYFGGGVSIFPLISYATAGRVVQMRYKGGICIFHGELIMI